MSSKELKTPYYMFYADEFIKNYKDLENSMKAIYENYQIAYSFKTNYTPAVCSLVKSLGGYAEVVSDMEYSLALKIGYAPQKIVYNGPGKGSMLEHCLLNGGLLNIDNFRELEQVCSIAENNPDKKLEIGIRVNFDIGNGLHSRFGLDSENGDFQNALSIVDKIPNLQVRGLHFHISRARGLDSWKNRIIGMLKLVEKHNLYNLQYIDLGSGMYGKLDPELQEQFGDTPSFDDYANVVACEMQKFYSDKLIKPMLITEPGTTIVSKYFHVFMKVLDIKEIRGKNFALIDGSFHNVGEICGLKKVPMKVINVNNDKNYQDVDFVGYTCLEQDVIYSGYTGNLGIGDIVEIYNVGGYSIVDKPPFIHPDIPIYMLLKDNVRCIKREQTLEDIFAPYEFVAVEAQ
ncbi:diaminopimelate decarboxylase [Phascolarctobacterium sp.]|uniref:diaminopimelate decarboxylase n=1 Tax=Phascolarctobacterium sp. TaxID=2049039 RepID=UPI003F7D51F8